MRQERVAAGSIVIEVLRAGLLDSVQDAGRFGLRHLGVGSAGALDAYSFTIANRLVGNRPDAAALEITLNGPALRLRRAATVALCGADIVARIDSEPLPGWRPMRLKANACIEFGACRRGARAYLAIDGGITADAVLGSRSTDLRAGFGGCEGRALRAGDRLPLSQPLAWAGPAGASRWWINPGEELDLQRTALARFVPLHADAEALSKQAWRLSATSSRQGLRLSGTPLPLHDAGQRVSEPVAPGTLQLPPDGQPIVLMAEAQTVGGYARLGHVISADLPRLAQLRPGETLHFLPVSIAEAQRLQRAMSASLARMALAIETRLAASSRR